MSSNKNKIIYCFEYKNGTIFEVKKLHAYDYNNPYVVFPADSNIKMHQYFTNSADRKIVFWSHDIDVFLVNEFQVISFTILRSMGYDEFAKFCDILETIMCSNEYQPIPENILEDFKRAEKM